MSSRQFSFLLFALLVSLSLLSFPLASPLPACDCPDDDDGPPEQSTYLTLSDRLSVTQPDTPFITFVTGSYFVLQGDGNVVYYDATNKARWSTQTAGRPCTGGATPNCNLTWQSDGNWVLYNNGAVVWATNTAGRGRSLLLSNYAPYVVVYDQGTPYGIYNSGGPRPDHSMAPESDGLSHVCDSGKCVIVYSPP